MKDYAIPESNVVIEKGTSIMIPIHAIHHDEAYFPDPEKFDPMRFSENQTARGIAYMPYFPFGEGPRNCIAKRMGKSTIKVAVASVLSVYCIELDDQHIGKELKMSPTTFTMTPEGIFIKIKSRNSIHSYAARFGNILVPNQSLNRRRI